MAEFSWIHIHAEFHIICFMNRLIILIFHNIYSVDLSLQVYSPNEQYSSARCGATTKDGAVKGGKVFRNVTANEILHVGCAI